jgi:hypothetical protein
MMHFLGFLGSLFSGFRSMFAHDDGETSPVVDERD